MPYQKKTTATTPIIIIDGIEKPCRNLLQAEGKYKKLKNTNKVAVIYNNLIYHSNYEVKGYQLKG